MNQSRESETEALRSDIDVTRRRMDETIDALGSRMQPRHLLDEVLGYFRGTDDNGNTRLNTMREKLSSGSDAALHTVVDTVKKNPLPALLIGAGVAWMIYNSRRSSTSELSTEYDTSADTTGMRYDPDDHYDRPLEYPTGMTSGTDMTSGFSDPTWNESSGSKVDSLKGALGNKASAAKDKLAQAGSAAKDRLGAMRSAAGDKFSAAKQRAGEIGSRVKTRTGEMYSSTRQRVVTTADQHPLELGLVCLAAGVIAGLALPTPNAVNQKLGPTADRLREQAKQQGQDIVEKGKRVANAAVSAVKEEAQAQGLTPDRLREKAVAVADKATEAGRETARREGLPGTGGNEGGSSLANQLQGNQSGSQSSDPTIARPAV
jgi:ElaB/YqjD/DUF883 family membrane-anchored ribosome-binding protein